MESIYEGLPCRHEFCVFIKETKQISCLNIHERWKINYFDQSQLEELSDSEEEGDDGDDVNEEAEDQKEDHNGEEESQNEDYNEEEKEGEEEEEEELKLSDSVREENIYEEDPIEEVDEDKKNRVSNEVSIYISLYLY